MQIIKEKFIFRILLIKSIYCSIKEHLINILKKIMRISTKSKISEKSDTKYSLFSWIGCKSSPDL